MKFPWSHIKPANGTKIGWQAVFLGLTTGEKVLEAMRARSSVYLITESVDFSCFMKINNGILIFPSIIFIFIQDKCFGKECLFSWAKLIYLWPELDFEKEKLASFHFYSVNQAAEITVWLRLISKRETRNFRKGGSWKCHWK